MEKIFGKSILLGILLATQLSATIRLQLQSLDGQTITRATAGQPFIVQVHVSDLRVKVSEPIIEGLEAFDVVNAGYQITLINGVQSLQYRYQVRIDTPGVYTIGPARISNPPESSTPQTITVIAPTSAASSIAGNKRSSQTQPLLELMVDRDHVYTGQKIRATLRFTASDAGPISIEPLVMQPMPALTVYHTSQPEQRKTIIDGKGYNQVEVHIDMYPTKSGRIVIPSQFVDYTKETVMDAALGNFAALFGPRYERKRVHSNAITLDVIPLPAHKSPIALIGELTRFDAIIEPTVAQQYEGLVLKLVFEGDAHFAGLPTPELQQMPSELKYYPSRCQVEELVNGQRYVCEYIVQGLQPGDYEIPPQTVAYFDTETGNYKSKKTTPLFVTIMAATQPKRQQPHPAQSSAPLPENMQEESHVVEQPDIALLCEDMDAHTSNVLRYALPWWLLLVLICMFYAGLHIYQLQVYVTQILERIAPVYMQRRFFLQIKKQLTCAVAEQDYHALQHLLTQVIARRLQRAPEHIDQEAMLAYVDASSWPVEKKQRWQQFLQRLREHLYAQHSNAHDMQLFAATELWLDEFERNT